jgi:hypothetical protein
MSDVAVYVFLIWLGTVHMGSLQVICSNLIYS